MWCEFAKENWRKKIFQFLYRCKVSKVNTVFPHTSALMLINLKVPCALVLIWMQHSFETHFFERTFWPDAHSRPGAHLRAGAQTGKYGTVALPSKPACYLSLGGDKVRMLPHTYPHKPPKKISGHMQSPGWQITLRMAWCLIWWFASLEKVWSYMTPNVLTETRCR